MKWNENQILLMASMGERTYSKRQF